MKKKRPLASLEDVTLERTITLPLHYREFYKKCIRKKPKIYTGTDLYSDTPEIQQWAIDLLRENDIPNFLKADDFVFLMHQGYTFCYFRADGKENPDVWNYTEGDAQPKFISTLEEYLKT